MVGSCSLLYPLDGLRFCPYCYSIYTVHVDHCGIDGKRLIDSDDDPLIGHELDRYEVLECIGTGAMGCVYRVKHNVLEHEYAMKVLFGDLGSNRKIVARFRREAQAVSKMRHPNILSVTDFGTSENGLTFLVMEYLPGRTLERLIKEEAPLKAERVASIAQQIAAGLNEAHDAGFVHRDVKPANIMLSTEGDMEFIKILDFGIVGMMHEWAAPNITGTNVIVGTPLYMAPEQARNPHEVTPAADLYSLGILIYEMLSGAPPFIARETLDLFIKHSQDKPEPLEPAGGLELLVNWLLEKNPADRPQAAAEVVSEIQRITPIEAPKSKKPVSSPYAETVEMEPENPQLIELRARLETLRVDDTIESAAALPD